MKRSEMVKALQEWLKRCDYPCSAWEFVEQAEDIIEFLESKGMQPPPYTFKHEVVNPTTVKTISVTNYEWEDEE
jgi:hypothetical protein